MATFDVVVLAGGTGRRLGGIDKGLISVGGRTLLDRALLALPEAQKRVVVGVPRTGFDDGRYPGLLFVREKIPESGPLAGLAAGAEACRSPILVVLAVDMPFLDDFSVREMLARAHGRDGAVLVDKEGRRQPLAAVYRREALLEALRRIGNPANRPMRLLLDELDLAEVPATHAALDIDTPQDLENAMLIDWTNRLAEELGVGDELMDLDLDAILDLARDAAHAIERPAAPLTTFLAGYAAARRASGPEAIGECIRMAGELARAAEPTESA